jgi:hypothetical protein
MKVTRVEVKVYEDGEEVGQIDIGYYHGQDYIVELVTPDGRDGFVTRVAAEPIEATI